MLQSKDPPRTERKWAVSSLVVNRIVYAINWLNVGAIFYLMSTDLGGGVTGLGNLTSGFYLGVGTIQIPGGILAAKWGPKKTVVVGMIISSSAVIGTSLSPLLSIVVALRFLVGTGMALVFAPSVVLATRMLGGRSGAGAGLINSAFDVGGLLGLFGWILIASATGCRPSLFLCGALGLVTASLVFLNVPDDNWNNHFRPTRRGLARVLTDRNMIILGFGALASNLGSVLISSFMVYYLHLELGEPAVIAGSIAALVTALPIVTSLWGGQFYDRLKKPRLLLMFFGSGMSVALLFCSIANSAVASVGTALAGIAVGPASTISFAAAKDLSKAESEYESLVIGWVNSISLTGSVWPPLLFSYLAATSGYPLAWFSGAVLTVTLLVPILFLVPQAPRERVNPLVVAPH